MRVRLLLFAVLRDIEGVDARDLEVAEGTTPLDLWGAMRERQPRLAAWARPPMTAVNREYTSPETPLHDGDEVAFIPPVSGGH